MEINTITWIVSQFRIYPDKHCHKVLVLIANNKKEKRIEYK